MAYVHRMYSGQFDWFMRADDDSFIVMENLHLFLHDKEPTLKGTPLECCATKELRILSTCQALSFAEVYGMRINKDGGYVATGAGLTMSAHNFELAYKSLDFKKCAQKGDTHGDDVAIAECIREVRSITPWQFL